MTHKNLAGPAPRLWLGILIALTLVFCLGFAWAEEAPGPVDIPPGVRLMPAIDGYPAGQTLPMLFLVKLADGNEISKDSMAKPMELLMASPGLKVDGGQLVTFGSGQSMAILRINLTVEPTAEIGRRMVSGSVRLFPKDSDPIEAPFVAPVNVLPEGGQPTIISAEMLERLGIDPPANGKPMEEAAPKGPTATSAPAARPETMAAPAQAAAAEPQATPENDPFAGKSLALILVLVFAGGLALNLTPCVYPLIPITVGFFGGRAEGGSSRSGLLVSALAYWAGMAITYTVLGAFVALSGRLLGEALTHPAVLAVIIAVILLMASSMFGLWEIRLPASLNRLAGASRGGIGGALIMGLTVGLLAAPCVGPFVVGLMTHVAQVAQVGYGLLVFFALAVGLGLPLAALAFFSGMLTHLPGAGGWMIWVRRLFGVVLVLMAVNVARPLLSDESYNWLLALLGAAGAIYLGFIEPSGGTAFRWFKRLFGLAALAAAALYLAFLPAPPQEQAHKISWVPFSPAVLEEAAAQGKPALVYFTADWCAPCRMMKADTWPDPRIIEAMKDFVCVEADVTTGASAEMKPYVSKWIIQGVPSIIFLDAKGDIMPQMTAVGFAPPDALLARLKAAKKLAHETGSPAKAD